jgi:hypothetical protein
MVAKDRSNDRSPIMRQHSATVAEILNERVVLELEGIDRLYLNAYVPRLQHDLGVLRFFREQRGAKVASSVLMAPMSRGFVQAIEQFCRREQVPLVPFEKGQRKDDIAKARLLRNPLREGVLFVGKAQEKASVWRTEKRLGRTGKKCAWLVRSTAMVNHYYFYCVDEDFGPFFLKFCSYFPYTAKLCLNGHEYLKRQLEKEHIAYEALGNGILSCTNVKRAQAIADRLSPSDIEALFRKWLARLPHPYKADDMNAGYAYDLSILQAEFSLTQVLDRPQTGRIFFEQVIRENLDIGRPDQVQLLFRRRVTKRTPGRFRTRIITDGVTPTLHVDYKHCRIKQYHKEGRALRTETTINHTRDFGIGKRLRNLSALREIGFSANRRLLDVQRLSHDCHIGEEAFHRVTQPLIVEDQRAPALRFDDPRVQMLLAALVLFRLLPHGFSNRILREHLALLLGNQPSSITQGMMTYDLRRLRLHGLIERIPGSHRYRVTDFGLRTALFFTRAYGRIFRDGLSEALSDPDRFPVKLAASLRRLESDIDELCRAQLLAA